MTPRYTSSKPNTWVLPRQSRPADWGHGRIVGMDEERRKELVSWIGLIIGGFAVGVLAFVSFAYACGPVPA